MYFNVSFDSRALVKDLLGLDTKLDRNMRIANKAAAMLVQETAINNIQRGSRSGRFYRRRSILHQASAPGEFPKSDTGDLVASINYEVDGDAAYVGSNLKYATYLENGTLRMDARPWLVRSYEQKIDKIKSIYDSAVKDALK